MSFGKGDEVRIKREKKIIKDFKKTRQNYFLALSKIRKRFKLFKTR